MALENLIRGLVLIPGRGHYGKACVMLVDFNVQAIERIYGYRQSQYQCPFIMLTKR